MACLRSYVGLCIHSIDIYPTMINNALNLNPTKSFARDRYRKRRHGGCITSDPCRQKILILSSNHDDHLSEIFRGLRAKEKGLERLKLRLVPIIEELGNSLTHGRR